MKKIGIFLSVCVAFNLFPLRGGDLESILEKNYESRGGLEKLRKLKTLKAMGRVETPAMTMMFCYAVKDGKIRLEYELKETNVVLVHNGLEGWQINPMMGSNEPQRMGEKESGFLLEMADISGPLVDWRDKKNRLSLIGKTRVKDREVYKVKVVTDAGHEKMFLLGADNGLVHMVKEKMAGKPHTSKITEAYQTVSGIVFPARIRKVDHKQCGHKKHEEKAKCYGQYIIRFDKITVNEDIEDEVFRLQGSGSLLVDKR